jgi:hypothetical protein
MLTLTYPGDWRSLAPSPEASKAHLAAFSRRWFRKVGRLPLVWKLEFQRRGAPHYHLLVLVPDELDVRDLRAWVASAWFGVVGSGDVRHLHAGTSVDVQYRHADASGIGFYFAKHGLWESKQYQNDPPVDWATTGRWWGMSNLPKCSATVEVPATVLVNARRLLRKWYRATHQPRLVLREEEVHDGRAVQRVGHVRSRLRSVNGGRRAGATVLVADGPTFALSLGRALGLGPMDKEGEHAEEEEPEHAVDRAAGRVPRAVRRGVHHAVGDVPRGQ